MNAYHGSGRLFRLALRRDRVLLPVWLIVLTALVASTAQTFKNLFKTTAAREQFAATSADNPALTFLYGQLHGSSIGQLTAWRYGVYSALGAGLMSIFVVIRHTRADEETGRQELVGAAPVGRRTPLLIGLLVALLANVVLAALMALVLVAAKLPGSGALALALAAATGGLAFTGVAAVAAQLTESARAARGLAIGVLGACYLLRAIGDPAGRHGPAWLSWLSPLGWAERVQAFAGNRWWVLVLPLATTAVLTSAAYLLVARRDYGTGLLAARSGPAQAGGMLRGPIGLSWRLQRIATLGWAVAFVVAGAATGVAAKGIDSLLGDSATLRHAFTRVGGHAEITNAFLAAVITLAGLVATAYAVSAVLRLESEETAGRADSILVNPVSRIRWATGHLLVVTIGTAIVLAAGGLSLGLGYGLRNGNPGAEVARLFGAAMVQLPAALAVAAFALIVFGVQPRWSVIGGWAAMAVAVLITLFGSVLKLAQGVRDISPFTHVPKLPGAAVNAMPVAWLCVAVLAMTAAGIALLRRRDMVVG